MPMQLTFYKYQGTGNDFVMIDNRSLFFPKENTALIAFLCDRRFGIGADGLILLENDISSDFKMVYYNADGHESTMCGNGGRCLVAFAKQLGIIQNETTFTAVDGLHFAYFETDVVALQMKSVADVHVFSDFIFLDTGSPHHVCMVEDLENYPVKQKGAEIRYSSLYKTAGTNVNFVSQNPDKSFSLRTYERGVEDETLSCGTGATAAALAMHKIGKTTDTNVVLKVLGGTLEVSFDCKAEGYENVFLKGPARFVFQGVISI